MASITASNVTVGATASVVVQADGDGGLVVFHDESSGIIAFGAADVTTTTGFHIDAASTMSFQLPPGLAIYGIAATAGNTLKVMVIDN